jgi:hypothetical protein
VRKRRDRDKEKDEENIIYFLTDRKRNEQN